MRDPQGTVIFWIYPESGQIFRKSFKSLRRIHVKSYLLLSRPSGFAARLKVKQGKNCQKMRLELIGWEQQLLKNPKASDSSFKQVFTHRLLHKKLSINEVISLMSLFCKMEMSPNLH